MLFIVGELECGEYIEKSPLQITIGSARQSVRYIIVHPVKYCSVLHGYKHAYDHN